MNKEVIDSAYQFVNNFRAYDPTTNSRRKISFDYCVPSIRGIHYSQHKKDLESVKPSTLEYIVFYLHNAEPKMIEDAIIALFYYWKVRMQNRKKMKEVYNRVLVHYTRANSNDSIPLTKTAENDAWLYSGYIVYSISFCIGSIKVNKFGFTKDKNRYRKLISDIRAKYSNVSVGSFEVYQEIGFDKEGDAIKFEKEALKNLVSHPHYNKCKCCFEGYKESYIDQAT